MGDGRYYTYYQFWGVVILVLLSIAVLFSTVSGYYKNRGNKNDTQLLHLFVGLNALIMVKIIEFVIPSMNKGLFFRSVFIISMFFLELEWFNYFNSSFLKFKNIYNRFITWTGIAILAIIAIVTKGDLFFQEYLFFETAFTFFYAICCFAISLVALFFVLISAFSKRKIHRIYKNITITGMQTIFCFFPLLFYAIFVYLNTLYIDFAEIYILAMLAVSFNIVMYNQAPSGITVMTFEKIGDIISDYILVIDINGKIVYRNRAIQQSSFFVSRDWVKLAHLDELYRDDLIDKDTSKKEEYFHLLDGEKEYYFGHQIDRLIDKEEVIGYIITIVDITELMELLFQLEDTKLQAKEVNEQLENYAEVVYNVEKEKQINVLLEKILSSREDDVKELIKKIDQLIQNEKQDDLEIMLQQIDLVIKFNQQIIDEVRKTVNSYK